MTYSEKLRDPRWQKRRLFILERDGWKCLSCGSTTKNLQVHHIIYERGRDPWDYADHQLKTYCDLCHYERQVIADNIANFFRVAVSNIPTDRLKSVCEIAFSKSLSDGSKCLSVADAFFKSLEKSFPGESLIDGILFRDTLKQLLTYQVERNRRKSDLLDWDFKLGERLRLCADETDGRTPE